MHDEKHYNLWETWFKEAFQNDEFTSKNSLWLSYFIAGESVVERHQKYAFKKVLQTVYTSMPEVLGVLFLGRKYSRFTDLNLNFPFYNRV